MTKIVNATDKLDQAVQLARTALASPLRDELAAVIVERISYLAQSHLTPKQRAEIRRRLALPPQHASNTEVAAIFAKYRLAT